jgi:hypothetical protein
MSRHQNGKPVLMARPIVDRVSSTSPCKGCFGASRPDRVALKAARRGGSRPGPALLLFVQVPGHNIRRRAIDESADCVYGDGRSRRGTGDGTDEFSCNYRARWHLHRLRSRWRPLRADPSRRHVGDVGDHSRQGRAGRRLPSQEVGSSTARRYRLPWPEVPLQAALGPSRSPNATGRS